MFEQLSDKLKGAFLKLRGKTKITEADLEDTLTQVRKALLEADVALIAINALLENIRTKYLGEKLDLNYTAEQFLIKLVKQELITLMGEQVPINLKMSPPAVILMVGLQGSGKTTSSAKLAKFIQDKFKKKVMLASCDIYRPAAILQLEQVAEQVNAEFFQTPVNTAVIDIAKQALTAAKKQFVDVLILDTAGRMHIDEQMMLEAKQLHDFLQPIETLFVVDSMTGQDAANTAQLFNAQLNITGVILTKLDGDTRGGAALSVRHITQKPIKFYGVGEKLDALEIFHPDRIASRILGMGDVLTLVEELEAKIDKKQAEKLAKKISQNKRFSFEDLREQLKQMNNMGGIGSIMDKLPGMSNLPANLKDKINDGQTKIMIAIIDSMTPKERIYPALLNKPSRKTRICKGSGTKPQDFNKLIKHFQQMEKMMQKFSGKGNMMKMLKMMQNKLPPGILQ